MDTSDTYLTVKFASATGHTVDDTWSFTGSLLIKGTDTGWAAHDIDSATYAFVDRTRNTASYQGTGSRSATFYELLKMNGRDKDGNTASFNPLFTVPQINKWIGNGFVQFACQLRECAIVI